MSVKYGQPLSDPRSGKSSVMSSSTAKSVNLEEPFVPNNRISSTSEATAKKAGIVQAPVGAEPPLSVHAGVHGGGGVGYHQVLQPHELRKEDVMEAPQDFNQV